MSAIIKSGGSLTTLERGDVLQKHSGAIKNTEQIWVKSNGSWVPMFPTIATARWGYASYAGTGLNENGYTGPQSFIDSNLTNLMPSNENNETFTYNLVDDTTYAYFAYPKSLGTATFTDDSNGFVGGWDGAKHNQSDSNFDTTTGPITVQYDDGFGVQDWYVYRTDFAGPYSQDKTFRVDYPNRPAVT